MIIRIFNHYIPPRRIILFGLESLFILMILILFAHGMDSGFAWGGQKNLLPKAFLIVMTVQVCLYTMELYDFRVFRSNLEMTIRLMQSLGSALIILATLYFFFPFIRIGRGTFLSSLIFIGLVIFGWRLLYNAFLKIKYVDQKMLILGEGTLAKNIAEEIIDQADSGFKIVGFIAQRPEKIGDKIMNTTVIGTHEQILDLALNHKVNRIIVAHEDRRNILPLKELLECKTKGIKIEEGIEFYERLTGKLKIENLNPSFIIFSDGFKRSRITGVIKRSEDIVMSFIGVIVLSPLVLLISLLIKIDSSGPVFYRQERVGENGRIFDLLKFRSMRDDAELSGPVWAKKNDNRITRVGRWLRNTRFDEIPQLINVLKGEMSFVGPRPERFHFVEQLRKVIPFYDQRFCVLPGITGWAQVKYHYGASVEDAAEKLKYDLYYIKNMSLGFDLFIIFETIRIVLFGTEDR